MEGPLAKKSLGQHWLNDQASLAAIVDSAEISPEDTVLEIGSGQGSLTKYLLAGAKQVIAVEVDENLAQNLSHQFAVDNLIVIQADILRFDFTSLPAGYKIVANIPYYLTGNLLRILCESENPFSQAALLVQKEVAERAAALPGSMSLLSVSAQFYCQVTTGQVVPAALFEPPPKVDSQILILKYRTRPLFEDIDTKLFFRIVKAGFSQRRKTLENSLSAGLIIAKDQARAKLEAAGVAPDSRAQSLSLDDWYKLYRIIAQ